MLRTALTRNPQANSPARAARTGVHATYCPAEPASPSAQARSRAIRRPRGGAADDGVAAEPLAPALAAGAAPGESAPIATDDWDDLFCAVQARLKLTVGEAVAAGGEAQLTVPGSPLRATVLECVEALDQLHAAQRQELARRRRLELEVFAARTALAQARAELAASQSEKKRAPGLALHDRLTSLPNRSFFQQRLAHVLSLTRPQRQALAVLYLDLDGFQPINDAYGHATGDELLRIVAARLTQTVRAEDMVSRVGGDEFACLLGGLPSLEQLSQVASNLVDAVSAPVKIGPLKLSLRPRIGIAVCHADGATAEALLKNADAAMCQAKRLQTGYAFFDRHTDV